MQDNLESARAIPAKGASSEATTAPDEELEGSDVGLIPEPWNIPTNPPPTSDEEPQVQEQPTSPPASAAKEIPDIEKLVAEKSELARRKLQGEYDQRLHQERLRAQVEARAELDAQLQQRAEQQRVGAMDDEEFGRYFREQSKVVSQQQAIVQQAQQQAALGWVNTVRVLGEKKLTEDEKTEFQRRSAPGAADQFQSFEEMLDFVTDKRVQRELGKALKDKEKAIREAIEKERTATEADESATVLDSGRPTPSDANASSEDNILAGFIEMQKRSRRG